MQHHAFVPGPFLRTLFLILAPVAGWCQSGTERTIAEGTLEQVVAYALVHQPEVREAQLTEEITDKTITGKLADWFPQVNFAYNYQRYIDLQASVIGGNVIRFGVENTSSFQFTGTQTIFNRDVLLASSTASTVREIAALNTSRTKLDVIVDVTKAYYDVLATAEQIRVTEESIVRLNRSLTDAYSRYTAGIADKTDYQRATILLNNAKADLAANEASLRARQDYLKALMGYPLDQQLPLQYDTASMEALIELDAVTEIDFSSNIDHRILSRQKDLQEAEVRYSYWGFLPSLNVFGAYNLNYQHDDFSELYAQRYPFSYVGATLSLPLLQGGKRFAKIREAKLTYDRISVQLADLENDITSAYTSAMAAYNGNRAAFEAQKENVALAHEVYDIINLQYNNGIKTYLDVTIAESDLRTARINYYHALYRVLASKMDVLRVLGRVDSMQVEN